MKPNEMREWSGPAFHRPRAWAALLSSDLFLLDHSPDARVGTQLEAIQLSITDDSWTRAHVVVVRRAEIILSDSHHLRLALALCDAW